MTDDNERFKRPEPRPKRVRKEPTGRSVLKDNSLLLDRPYSYWTIGVFSLNAAFFALVSSGQAPPLWLGFAVGATTLPWLFVFLRGGAWEWIRKMVPELKSPPGENKGVNRDS